ncbi:MAG: NADH-quinone oxidoreductase subunit M [Paludibaculum sp.]
MNLLNILLIVPAAGFLLTLLLPKDNPGLVRNFTLFVSLIAFLLSLGLIGPVLAAPHQLSFETNAQWIEYPSIRYHVGLDGLSLWLVILSTFLTPLVILVSWKYVQKRVKEYYAFLLFLLFGVLGVFVALDLFLFFVFWELSLVPMYFLIGIWGHDKRIYAAVKFFLYTMAGSALMLIAMVYLYNKSGTFDIPLLMDMMAKGRLVLNGPEGFWLFMAFFLAFAIKVPLFPLHTWLPDAHGEAPTAGSVMLASVLLKLGTYGIVRICLPLFPEASHQNAQWIIGLAIGGIIYGALVAMVQPNMKRLVAYSSVSHLGFVILGVFTFTQVGLDGAVYQMLNHGISTGALFILVGMLYERRHSLEIADYGGVGTVAPWLSTMFVITTLASVGLPLLNNFVGEFLVLQGAAERNFLYAVFAAVGVILSAVYMLWMVQRTFYGETPEEVKHHFTDLSVREWGVLLPLIAMMIWMGIGSGSFIPAISASDSKILSVVHSKAPVAGKELANAR